MMATSKVEIMRDGQPETLIDLTGDTITEETAAEGTTFHDATGEQKAGKMPITNVLYTEQNLTDAQKQQARTNIGAANANDLGGTVEITNGNPTKAQTVMTIDPSGEEVSMYTADEVDQKLGVLSEQKADKSDLDDLKAQGVQQVPLFANSISECTDTTKMYVLPDGFIYAYTILNDPLYTNVIKESIGSDGAIFNSGQGWADKSRIGSGTLDSYIGTSTYYITGHIPIDHTVDNVIRLKNITFDSTTTDTKIGIAFYDANFARVSLKTESSNNWLQPSVIASASYGYDAVLDGTNIVEFLFEVGSHITNTEVTYFAICAEYIGNDSVITINEEIVDVSGGYAWQNTGRAFVPGDYEDLIVGLDNKISKQAEKITKHTEDIEELDQRIGKIEEGVTTDIPEYWLTHLSEKIPQIRDAVLNTGANKSAFYFYSDSHWSNDTTYTAKMAPKLLKYLYQNTPINKTNFGGDIVSAEGSDSETMAYLWDWRSQLYGLVNHHSVVGNHDDGNTTNNLFSESYVYGYLLAPEETADIVRGDEGMYYYIDNPSEKTRYLYLDTAYKGVTSTQQDFVKSALQSAPSGWHIVVISHIWYYNDYSNYPPVLNGFDTNAKIFLDMFDSYNARSGDFASCTGKVEFCIGGHYHLDHNEKTTGGIPVIIVEADALHDRSGTMPSKGTTDESAISAIVANYNAKTINIIRIGRGSDITITY